MTDNTGFVDTNYQRRFFVYVDGRYVGVEKGADEFEVMRNAVARFNVRAEQKCTVQEVKLDL